MTDYALRLCIDHRHGDTWTVATVARPSVTSAARWRDETRAWCQANPLPTGYEYRIPLPRPRK